MPDLNYYRLFYVIRRIRSEITSISGTSMKWINAVNFGLTLLIHIAADIELRNHELLNESR